MAKFYVTDMIEEPISSELGAFDRLENDSLILEAQAISNNSRYPLVDVSEDEATYILRAELPGFNKKDIEISYKDQVLTLKGERSRNGDLKGNSLHTERFAGKFMRQFTLADVIAADKIRAQYRDGVLKIILPKVEDTKPKEIKVENN